MTIKFFLSFFVSFDWGTLSKNQDGMSRMAAKTQNKGVRGKKWIPKTGEKMFLRDLEPMCKS